MMASSPRTSTWSWLSTVWITGWHRPSKSTSTRCRRLDLNIFQRRSMNSSKNMSSTASTSIKTKTRMLKGGIRRKCKMKTRHQLLKIPRWEIRIIQCLFRHWSRSSKSPSLRSTTISSILAQWIWFLTWISSNNKWLRRSLKRTRI